MYFEKDWDKSLKLLAFDASFVKQMVVVTLVISAICAVVSLAGKICEALRMHTEVLSVKYVPPQQGFAKLISTSFTQALDMELITVNEVMPLFMKDIDKFVPQSMLNESEALRKRMKNEIDYKSYLFRENKVATFVVTYNNETKKFWFYMNNLAAIDERMVRFTTMTVDASFEMPEEFFITEVREYNAFVSNTKHSVERRTAAVTSQAIVDAISMSLAPIFTGDVKDDKYMLDQMRELAASVPPADKANATTPSMVR